MLKAKDINGHRLEKNTFGYKTEDVDGFLNEVAADYAQLEKDNEEINAKLQVLADKVREYRKDEEAVKDALLFAQKEGHRVVTEANEKAEEILRNAKLESEKMVNDATMDSKKAISEIKVELKREQKNLMYLQKQVSTFKKNLFDMYKSHLEMISSMPQSDEEYEEEDGLASVSESQDTSAEVNQPEPAVENNSVPETAVAEEKTEEKLDPFRTQSIPIIGGGDVKYSELQFGQQNNK